MKPISAARRLIANTDQLNDLVQAANNLARDVNEKLDNLQQAADNMSTALNDALDRLQQGLDNHSGNTNTKFDALIEAANNQSGCLNEKLDGLIAAITHQSTSANVRLDRLIAASRHDDRAPQHDSSKTAPSAISGSSIEIRPAAKGTPDQGWLKSSPSPLPLPRWSGAGLANGAGDTARAKGLTNAMRCHQPLLDALEPWHGQVPKGYLVDFLGILTDAHFRTQYGIDPGSSGGAYAVTGVPRLEGNGEWWFEVINWLEAAREARGHFVMMTLGACYGAQAVGACRALQIVNPMPCTLVAVEPVPENYLWVQKHFRDNGIDPEDHWLIQAATSNVNEPVFFPIGAPGSGANNCMSTDTREERKILSDRLVAEGQAAAVLQNLMLNNTTGVIKDLLPGQEATAEIQLVSAVTLHDLLAPFGMVDYVEADIQQSEARVFPPFIDLLRKKVRRIHIGTHGADTHTLLHQLFAGSGWEIVFSYAPEGQYESDLGSFELNDGVLTVRNPDL